MAVQDVGVKDSPQNFYLVLTTPWAGEPDKAWARQDFQDQTLPLDFILHGWGSREG